MHGQSRSGPRYESRIPFQGSQRSVSIERMWRFEREVSRARQDVDMSVERSLDWLVMLSLARDWSQGIVPDVASTTATVELPRTTVKRSLDSLLDKDVVVIERCRRDGRRRLIKPGMRFDEVFDPLFEKVYELIEEMGHSLGQAVNAVVDTMSDAVLITSAPPPGESPRIIGTNDAMSELTGYSYDEVIGKSPSMLQGDGTSEAARQRLRKAIEKREGTTETLVNYRKDGSTYLCELTLTPLQDENGAIQYFMGIAREVAA